jgi:hypothetical protein
MSQVPIPWSQTPSAYSQVPGAQSPTSQAPLECRPHAADNANCIPRLALSNAAKATIARVMLR